MAGKKPPTHVLALIARALGNKKPKHPPHGGLIDGATLGRKVKLRRSTPPPDSGGKGR